MPLLFLFEIRIPFCNEEEGVVHEVVLGHKPDVFQDLLTDKAHVVSLEAQELIIFANILKIDVLQAVFHSEWLVNLTIYDASFEIKFTELITHFQEQIVHKQNVNFLDILHFYCVYAINLCYETLWVFPEVVEIARQGLFKNFLLAFIHSFD